ncbi:MAG: ABC transporter substrate-binding protein [Nocardioidaceae bacterium]
MNRSSLIKSVGVLAVVTLAATGCSNSKPQTTSSAADTAAAVETVNSLDAPAKADSEYNLSFIQGVAGDEFYISMECGVEDEAAKLGVKVNTQGPQKFDPTLQKPIVDSVVASKPDAILIAPTDVTAMQTPLAAAKAAGIKIVLVDTTLKDPSIAVTGIASDNSGGGKAAFDAIKKLHPEGGKVLVMSTDPGISTVDARVEGFEKALEADPSFESVGVQYSHNDPATAAQLTSAALQKDPDLVGIFATNLFAAEGSATGLRQAGKQGSVDIVGFDAGPNQIKALRAGTVQALVAQQPATIGQYGVDAAVASLNGDDVPALVQTGFTVITKDNLDGAGADAVYKSTC